MRTSLVSRRQAKLIIVTAALIVVGYAAGRILGPTVRIIQQHRHPHPVSWPERLASVTAWEYLHPCRPGQKLCHVAWS